MKWTEEQTDNLRDLCQLGTSNADIATALCCKVTDVHAKRSQLGITIPKIKATQQQAPVKKTPSKISPHSDVKEAFRSLHDALLVAIGSDRVSDREAEMYADANNLLISIENLLYKSIQG